MDHEFLIGSATAGGQVEGYNTNSDIWAMEYMKTGGYAEPSLAAANHYHTYRQDIEMMHKAGLNAYRFSLEWARIEPRKGVFDEKEMNHYLDVIHTCRDNGIEPVITLFHFASPKWLIGEGGWEAESTVEYFGEYAEYVANHLKGENIRYIITINEANMGTLIAGYLEKMRKHMDGAGLQIGLDLEAMAENQRLSEIENMEVFGVRQAAVFTSPRTPDGDLIVCKAHRKAAEVLHTIVPETKVGMSLSLRDLHYTKGGKQNAEKDWEKDFLHYLPTIRDDDFFAIQTYTRAVFTEKGEQDPSGDAQLTQMGYEYYPECVEHVIRKVHESFKNELLISENGIATDDDEQRIRYIDTALKGVLKCKEEGIPVKGYMYWSFIDNWEWQSGYSMKFGLVSLDRTSGEHIAKPSLSFLGSFTNKVNHH